jgi:hypothetical protein
LEVLEDWKHYLEAFGTAPIVTAGSRVAMPQSLAASSESVDSAHATKESALVALGGQFLESALIEVAPNFPLIGVDMVALVPSSALPEPVIVVTYMCKDMSTLEAQHVLRGRRIVAVSRLCLAKKTGLNSMQVIAVSFALEIVCQRIPFRIHLAIDVVKMNPLVFC